MAAIVIDNPEDNPLFKFLDKHNLSQYYENFKSAGYDDLDTVQTMSEEELQNYVGIKLPGHRRKLTVEFAKMKTQIQHPAGSVLSVNEAKKDHCIV